MLGSTSGDGGPDFVARYRLSVDPAGSAVKLSIVHENRSDPGESETAPTP